MARSCLMLPRWRESSRNRKDKKVVPVRSFEDSCFDLDKTNTAIGIPFDEDDFHDIAQSMEDSSDQSFDLEPPHNDQGPRDLPVIHILALTEQWYMPSSHIDLRGAEEIGRGSCATVYRARLKESGSDVAIKVLSRRCSASHAMKDMMQEVIVASSLQKHPNIVSFLGASFEGSSIQIVYELVDGCTLEQLYNEECSGKRPSIDLVVSWSKQLSCGLAFLHDGKPSIIHRDVKPDNILISSDRSLLKLTDFGLCKVIDNQVGRYSWQGAQVTGEGSQRMSGNTGAWRYMAPEVFSDGQDGYTAAYSSSADVFSAGMVMWYMYHGEPPHIAIEPRLLAELTARQGLRPSLEKMQQEHQELARIVDRCWSPVSSERPSARELTKMLDQV